MERFDDDRLSTELRELRPTPRPEFAAELDERAAAGFPRRSRLTALRARIEGVVPRRVLLPAGAAAVTAVLVAAVVIANSDLGSNESESLGIVNETNATRFSGEGGGRAAAPDRSSNPGDEGSGKGDASARNMDGAGVQYETDIPAVSTHRGEAASAASSAGSAASPAPTPRAPTAPRSANRDVERSAEMVLGAEPGQVGNAARQVFEAVDANDGIVMRSSIRDGSEGRAGARLELLIPSGRLSDALADFSQVGEVISRHEATVDITAPTMTTGEHLRDSLARIDGLLAQLAEASVESERKAVEAELRTERRRAAALRAQLANLDRRASLSRVQVRIAAVEGSAIGGGDSSWGAGDALGDAGRILAVAAGVALLALAILVPLALIALAAWLAHRAWLRRGRQRALG